MNVSDTIRTKRAVRQFQEELLPDEMVRIILNYGWRSRSSKNNQPWQFIARREKGILKSLSVARAYAGHLARAALGVAMLISSPDEYFRLF